MLQAADERYPAVPTQTHRETHTHTQLQNKFCLLDDTNIYWVPTICQKQCQVCFFDNNINLILFLKKPREKQNKYKR